MESKIRGVEQELAMNTLPTLPHGSLVHLVGMAMEELKKAGLLTSIKVEEPRLDFMALNGFRVYNDMSHLELSTPSYNTPLEAVVYDKVAELFAFYAVKGLKGYFKEVNVYKNNISNTTEPGGSWNAVSYSTHSSVIMDRKFCNPSVWAELEATLIPYMVTRILLIGGGDLVPCLKGGGFHRRGKEISGDKLCYTISPRAVFIRKISSNDTVEARGLLNERDDPHADPERHWRLHDINWEGLRSPYQIFLRDCLETLVMLSYERGFLKDPPKLANPITTIKELSGDTEECDWKVNLENRRKVDAITGVLEGFYLARIEEMMDESSPTPVDLMGFNLIEATLKGLGERRLECFFEGLDWVTKKMLIEEYAPDSPEDALGICNQYALIDHGVLRYLGEIVDPDEVQTTFDFKESLGFAEDAIPLIDWDLLGKRIGYALRNGPEGTREYLRCLVAKEFPLLVESIEWERITFPGFTINLMDPFLFNRGMCGDLLEESTTNLDTFRRAISRLDGEGYPVTHRPIEDHEQLDDEDRGAVKR